jgi:hypothetical protein
MRRMRGRKRICAKRRRKQKSQRKEKRERKEKATPQANTHAGPLRARRRGGGRLQFHCYCHVHSKTMTTIPSAHGLALPP